MEEFQLVQRMKNGDREAFELLYGKYKNMIYRTACLISKNPQDGEDIAQETFIKIFLHCRELKSNEMFKYWILKILNRTAWHILKGKKSEEPDENILEKVEISDFNSPLNTLLHTEQKEIIWQAVKNLDYKQRTVVILYYYNDFTTKEIAKIIGCMEGTVKSRLFSARKRLKKMLSEELVQEGGGYHEI